VGFRVSAYHFGLVGDMVPSGQSLDQARDIAARVAAMGPWLSAMPKASVIDSGWIDEEVARKIERRFVTKLVRSADAEEGLVAFAAKREPRLKDS
jgi:enoyl-CoA hydratase